MGEEIVVAQGEFPLQPIGERLRLARERAGMSVDELAAETRISVRHLEMIEAGEFAGLPGRTYALGFSRTYAKSVGLDPGEVVGEVRDLLGAMEGEHARGHGAFEPGDPARMPSGRLGLISALAALLIFGATFYFFRSYFDPEGDLPRLESPVKEEQPAAKAQAAPETAAAGDADTVVFTAMEDGIWVKFYDAGGRELMQKQMALGERYRIPSDAEQPQLWTGRPDALAITVGGREIPPLAEEERVVRDVLVTAEALRERPPTAIPAVQERSPTG